MSLIGRWTLYPSDYGGDAIAAEGEERLIAVGPDVRRFTEVVDAATYRGAVDLLHDVATSGVSYDESRVRYVEVQIDRDTWEALAAYIERGQ